MAYQTFSPSHFTAADQPSQQRSLYTPSPSPATGTKSISAMAPPNNYQLAPAPYNPQQQAPPQIAPTHPAPLAADALEQRVLDLLYPYRDECFTNENGADAAVNLARERKAHVLSGNLAFLIRHQQASYGKQIEANDIFIASRFFKGAGQKVKEEDGKVTGLGVFVNGSGFTHTVVRVAFKSGENALELLTNQVDQLMDPFFPGT